MREDAVNILVKRDDMTKEEANDLIDQCLESLMDGNDEAIQDYLGLEDDYIFDIL